MLLKLAGPETSSWSSWKLCQHLQGPIRPFCVGVALYPPSLSLSQTHTHSRTLTSHTHRHTLPLTLSFSRYLSHSHTHIRSRTCTYTVYDSFWPFLFTSFRLQLKLLWCCSTHWIFRRFCLFNLLWYLRACSIQNVSQLTEPNENEGDSALARSLYLSVSLSLFLAISLYISLNLSISLRLFLFQYLSLCLSCLSYLSSPPSLVPAGPCEWCHSNCLTLCLHSCVSVVCLWIALSDKRGTIRNTQYMDTETVKSTTI